MKKSTIIAIILYLFTASAFAQAKFSAEANKYIDYEDSVTVFKNSLLIDDTGSQVKPHRTIMISDGKIDWLGDDVKAKTILSRKAEEKSNHSIQMVSGS